MGACVVGGGLYFFFWGGGGVGVGWVVSSFSQNFPPPPPPCIPISYKLFSYARARARIFTGKSRKVEVLE